MPLQAPSLSLSGHLENCGILFLPLHPSATEPNCYMSPLSIKPAGAAATVTPSATPIINSTRHLVCGHAVRRRAGAALPTELLPLPAAAAAAAAAAGQQLPAPSAPTLLPLLPHLHPPRSSPRRCAMGWTHQDTAHHRCRCCPGALRRQMQDPPARCHLTTPQHPPCRRLRKAVAAVPPLGAVGWHSGVQGLGSPCKLSESPNMAQTAQLKNLQATQHTRMEKRK